MVNIQAANITIMVSDMDAAVKFYTEILGLKLKNRYGNHWADIEGPGISIGLHPKSKDIKTGDNLQIGLNVNDLDEAVKALEEKGVQCKVHGDDQVRLAFFTDPDGNTLYLVQAQ